MRINARFLVCIFTVLVLISACSTQGNRSNNTRAAHEPSVLELQQRLQFLNYPVGTPDGIKGKQTTQAVRMFQSEMGLASSGVLNSRTTQALMGQDAKPLPALGSSGALGIPAKQLKTFCRSVKTLDEKSRCIAVAGVTIRSFGRHVNSMARLDPNNIVSPFACDYVFSNFESDVARYISPSRSNADRKRFLSIGQGCALPRAVHTLLFGQAINLSACDLTFNTYQNIRSCTKAILRRADPARVRKMRSAVVELRAAAGGERIGRQVVTAYVAQSKSPTDILFNSLKADLDECVRGDKAESQGKRRRVTGAYNLQRILIAGSAINFRFADWKKTLKRDEGVIQSKVSCDIASQLLTDLFDDEGGVAAAYQQQKDEATAAKCSQARIDQGPDKAAIKKAVGGWISRNCSASGFLNMYADDRAKGRDNQGSIAGLRFYKFTGEGASCAITSQVFPHYYIAPGDPTISSSRKLGTRKYAVTARVPLKCGSNGTVAQNALACVQLNTRGREYQISTSWSDKSCEWKDNSVSRLP